MQRCVSSRSECSFRSFGSGGREKGNKKNHVHNVPWRRERQLAIHADLQELGQLLAHVLRAAVQRLRVLLTDPLQEIRHRDLGALPLHPRCQLHGPGALEGWVGAWKEGMRRSRREKAKKKKEKTMNHGCSVRKEGGEGNLRMNGGGRFELSRQQGVQHATQLTHDRQSALRCNDRTGQRECERGLEHERRKRKKEEGAPVATLAKRMMAQLSMTTSSQEREVSTAC